MLWWPFGPKKIGLALGGGVARGIAHIGVLKVLDQHKVPIECIAATSSGSIVGAAYAAGLQVPLIEEIALRISWGRVLRVAFFRPGFVSSEALEELIIQYIGDIKFSDLKIPFAVMSTDIKTGEPVMIDQGRVAKAVAASTAFPGVFTPQTFGQRVVVDGGISDNVPVRAARELGAEYVVAVDVVPSRPIKHLPSDPFQVFGRSLDLVLHGLSVEQRKEADLLIEPELDEDIWHLDLHKAKRLIAAGESAAQRAIRKIKKVARV